MSDDLQLSIDLEPLPKKFGTEPYKLVRQQDPDTSHTASRAVDSSRLERLVYDTIKSFGINGCISDEVRDRFPEIPYSSITARYKALMERNLIEDTGERRKGHSSRPQRVMRAL